MVNRATMELRDFPDHSDSIFGDRRAVCKRCHCVMRDCEESTRHGEFYHPGQDKDGNPHWCQNANKSFDTTDTEIEPFLRKRDRRRNKRLGIRP
jgi:hypothetical protein